MRIVVPDWAKLVWKPEECTVEELKRPNADETHCVYDHNIDVIVVQGTKNECHKFLDVHGIGRIE